MRDSTTTPSSLMSGLDGYVLEVEALAREALTGRRRICRSEPALNGAADAALRLNVPRSARRSAGAFFTTSAIRAGDFDAALPKKPAKLEASDPACGGGDLLLQWSRRLPVGTTLETTLELWGELLSGVDMHSQFVRLARSRMVLEAASRCPSVGSSMELEDCFPHVVVGDGLHHLKAESVAPWTLMNPPYTAAPAPANYTLGSGSVSTAALFVSQWLDRAPQGARIVAILPEVLRTGSRYRSWRNAVGESCRVVSRTSLGQFAAEVDVDVFVLSARKAAVTESDQNWWPPPPKLRGTTVFKVSTGTVVPHRDPTVGAEAPFLRASRLPHEAVAPAPSESRRYDGRLFTPPFIAIRRTSRPAQWPRARATVVTGEAPVAVENHLIVLHHSSAVVADCVALVDEIQSPAVSSWLDVRLGGRHLTTQALVELLGGSRDD